MCRLSVLTRRSQSFPTCLPKTFFYLNLLKHCTNYIILYSNVIYCILYLTKTLSYCIEPYITLPYLTLPYFTLPYLNLHCLALSCFVLSYYVVWCCVVWCNVVQCDMVWYGTIYLYNCLYISNKILYCYPTVSTFEYEVPILLGMASKVFCIFSTSVDSS